MKKIMLTLFFLITPNIFPMEAFKDTLRLIGKKLKPDALVIEQEEISRSLGIFEEFIESLRTKKLDDLKRDPQFLKRIYQINCRTYQIGETIKGCIQNQRYVEASKAREILINHILATNPFITWLTYKALHEDGRISKETFEQYIKIEQERFYFMLKTLVPKDDEKKFSDAAHLLDKKEKKITVEIIDSTKQHESTGEKLKNTNEPAPEQEKLKNEPTPEQVNQVKENSVEQNQTKTNTNEKEQVSKEVKPSSQQNQQSTRGKKNR